MDDTPLLRFVRVQKQGHNCIYSEDVSSFHVNAMLALGSQGRPAVSLLEESLFAGAAR